MNRWKKFRHAAKLLTITTWHTALKERIFPGDVAAGYVGHGVHLTAVHLLAPVAPVAQRCVGSTGSPVGSRSTVGIKEGEERQKQKCAKCHGAVLTDCWGAKLSQKLCFSWAISATKPTVYRAAVYYSILYQLAFVYLVIYKLGFTNGFNIFDCSPINERQSWCVSPALDLNPHIYGICKTVIPNLSDQKYGIGTCIWADQILTLPIFTRNDQTKCPAKWDQISIAGLPIVKPQPQLFNIVSTKWHRPIQQNGSKWSKP